MPANATDPKFSAAHDAPKHELRAELRARRAQILSWLMYALFGFGGLWLFSATSPDPPREQHAAWDRIPQAEQAAIGVVQVAAGVLLGIAALVAYRRDVRVFAPGERRIGLQRPGRVVVAVVLGIAVIVVEIAWFGGLHF